MSQGEVVAAGPPEEVRHDERVIDAYLGSFAAGDGEGDG
jgi:ABC-type branched-subunit amino acid transport system ATPase component